MGALVFGVREPERAADADAKPGAAAAPVDAATQRTLAKYLVAVVLFGLGNSSDAFLLLRAQNCGVAVKWVPLLWMAHNATKAALSTWAGALSDRVGRRAVIVAGWALYAAVYLAFGFASDAWQIWSLFVLYGVYYALTEGAGRALVADLAPKHARGRAFGWYNAAVGLVALPASLGFGALADRYGARVPFTASALLALAASSALLLLVRPSAPAPAATAAR
jgi:MFS family permease